MRQTTILIMAAALTVTTTATAHGYQTDNNIWIETTDGNFVFGTEFPDNIRILVQGVLTQHIYDEIREEYWISYKGWSWRSCIDPFDGEYLKDSNKCYNESEIGEIVTITGIVIDTDTDIVEINQHKMTSEIPECKNIDINHEIENSPRVQRWKELDGEITQSNNMEEACGYWYKNTIKDEYKYTIIDLPKDRKTPENYQDTVTAGVVAGFDRWGDINDITFTHTDSRLEADIIIQQNIGDGITYRGVSYGNAEIGCLFDESQCTIQLFTDLNVRSKQTLLNRHAIEHVIAHEFGHLIGLPHHIEPGHIMNTVHHEEVRDYWEARNINVPRMTEPTYEQSLLENSHTYTDHTRTMQQTHPAEEQPTTDSTKTWNADNITEHEATIEFIDLIRSILMDVTAEERFNAWLTIQENIIDEIWDLIFPTL